MGVATHSLALTTHYSPLPIRYSPLVICSHLEVIDQPRRADPGGHQESDRPVVKGANRLQRSGVARLQVIDSELRLYDGGAPLFQHGGNPLALADLLGALPQHPIERRGARTLARREVGIARRQGE